MLVGLEATGEFVGMVEDVLNGTWHVDHLKNLSRLHGVNDDGRWDAIDNADLVGDRGRVQCRRVTGAQCRFAPAAVAGAPGAPGGFAGRDGSKRGVIDGARGG